jgi:GT2 family glycosyltransferase/SAM-dependent methyltransferase/glycosyltransferase involved in cell wall biosynthesis
MRHRAGAPRLIKWTGERCVPWSPDIQVVYEHLHRYLWAARLMAGRRVLDLASGEGFGAAILAAAADSVVGIEIDEPTVTHSRLNYADEKLDFQLGDATDLSRFGDDSFDAVVAFEMIEHVEDHQRVLAEIGRVLAPGGLLLMSTPDRGAYTVANERKNPFHLHELDRREFAELLRGSFEHVATWGQRTITGSALSSLDPSEEADAPARTIFVERHGDDWEVAGGLSPLYLVAAASDTELPRIPRDSTLADCELALMRAAEGAASKSVGERLRALQAVHERSDAELQRLATREDELGAKLAERDIEIDMRRSHEVEMAEQAAAHEQTIAELWTGLESERRLNAVIKQSVSWRLFARVRDRLTGLIGGPRSIPVRAVRLLLRMAASGGGIRGPEAPGLPGSVIELPEFERPKVSIVIPLYSAANLTRSCLETIRDRTTRVSYEVILVDDTADEDTKALLSEVRGARIVVNETNLGYLRSVKLGVSYARGRWLVLCNNDIQVQEGWLSALLNCAESSSDIGVVTPKYLYPDGSLQEAGGIIWRDGTGVNYGRGESPGDALFEFRREVDYGSAAALLVRGDFWRAIGGFDERFAPMYYEDTDLCFQARERGLRVVYEPRAQVMHIEGGTAGTDLSEGHKRHQEVNRPKFVEKWHSRLDAEQLRSSPQNVRQASNRNRGPHVLIVDHRVPFWDRDSGSLRMLGIIEALLDLGCRVTFLPDDRTFVLPYTTDLQAMGVEVWYGDLDVAGELKAIGPGLSLVITCRPHATSRWLDLIRECAPTVRVAYDTVDLHWLREARRAGVATDGDQVAIGPKAKVLRELELALIRATDATLVVSAEERAQVEADVPGAVVRVVPNVNEVRTDVPPAAARRGVMFIGGFEHTPNIDAAIRLVRRVMPRVWSALGDVPATIVGGSAPPEVRELASPLVEIAGWVPDVDPLFGEARAMVAPLTYGAGLKGKVTQALAAGVPVVTTPVGAEGLDATDGDQLLIAEDDRGLADRVIRVLSDDELWSSLSAAGQRVAASRCSPALVAGELAQLLGPDRLGSGVGEPV